MSSLPGVLSRSPPPETWATAVLKAKGGRFFVCPQLFRKTASRISGDCGMRCARRCPSPRKSGFLGMTQQGLCVTPEPAPRHGAAPGGEAGGSATPCWREGSGLGFFSTAEGRHKADLLHSGDLADRLLSLDRMYGSLRVRNRRAAHPRAGGTSQRAAPAGFSRAQGIGTGSCAPGAGCRGLCPFVHAGPGSTSEPVFPSARSVKG